MRRMFYVLIPVILILFSACSQPLVGLDTYFPKADSLDEWKWDGKPVHYDPETLYELINGEAELYHAYGFKTLSMLGYYSGSVEDTFLTVHIYDMGTPENAFGIYSSYRYPGYQFDNIGTEAMISDYGLKFYQGSYFIDITYGDMIEKIQQTGLHIAKKISEQIPEPAVEPDCIKLLSTESMQAYTLRYVAQDMLNQSFMPGGIEAKYILDSGEVTAFVVFFDTNEKAVQASESLKKFFTESGDKLLKEKLMGQGGFAVETQYEGIQISTIQGKYLAGVRGLENLQHGKKLLQTILDHLKQAK